MSDSLMRVRGFTGAIRVGGQTRWQAEFQVDDIWPRADTWLAERLAAARAQAPRADQATDPRRAWTLFWRVEWVDDHFCEAETPLELYDDEALNAALFDWPRGTLAAQVRAIVLDRAAESGYPESPDLAATFLGEREVGG